MSDRDRLIELVDKAKEEYANDITDHTETDYIVECLLNNGVIAPPKEEKKMVYFPFPIDCDKCPKVLADIGVCEQLDLLYAGKHPKYSKEQDWDFMCANCPKGVAEREYVESDEKLIGKTFFLTREEAEKALERSKSNA